MEKVVHTEIDRTIREDGIEVTTYRMHLNGRIICQDRWIEYDENNAPVSCISPLWLADESEAE